jgi:ABC-type Zn uptake system ZnuABC Zn-binding protein ZnuA
MKTDSARKIVRRLAFGSLGALSLLSFGARAQADPPLKVVVTLPVLKDLTEQIGREHVEVRSLVTGLENEHAYVPSPDDIAAVREARLFFRIGAGLETWADGLIRNNSRRNLTVVTTGKGVPLLRDQGPEETEPNVSSAGRHLLGNPHIWLDPKNAKTMLRNITDGLIKLDAKNKGVYLRNQAEYLKRLDFLEAKLKRKTAKLVHRKIVTHHPAWPYFARRFGFEIGGSLLTQAGTEPSTRWVAAVIKTMNREKIKVIVSEPQLDPRLPQAVAKETGAAVVLLTALPGAIPGTETYLSLIEYNVDRLVAALSR